MKTQMGENGLHSVKVVRSPLLAPLSPSSLTCSTKCLTDVFIFQDKYSALDYVQDLVNIRLESRVLFTENTCDGSDPTDLMCILLSFNKKILEGIEECRV